MTTDNTIIIFHRSRLNAEESIANQQSFLKEYNNYFPKAKVIDYITGDSDQASVISELAWRQTSGKIIAIINSPLSRKEYDEQYDMYYLFNSLKIIDKANLYFMDSEGKLYKETKLTLT